MRWVTVTTPADSTGEASGARDVEELVPLRAGIVGAGVIGAVHARAAKTAGAVVVGAVGSAPERGDAAATRIGARRGYADLAAMLVEQAVDVVHICTPNASHAELAMAVVRAGVHVVCEKPLTTDPESARLLVAGAERAGVAATVPFVYRFHPMAREFRARVLAGEPGQLAVIHAAVLASADNDGARVEVPAPARRFE